MMMAGPDQLNDDTPEMPAPLTPLRMILLEAAAARAAAIEEAQREAQEQPPTQQGAARRASQQDHQFGTPNQSPAAQPQFGTPKRSTGAPFQGEGTKHVAFGRVPSLPNMTKPDPVEEQQQHRHTLAAMEKQHSFHSTRPPPAQHPSPSLPVSQPIAEEAERFARPPSTGASDEAPRPVAASDGGGSVGGGLVETIVASGGGEVDEAQHHTAAAALYASPPPQARGVGLDAGAPQPP
eukprot:CAMPEP_0169436222 /NCGR_PEP_ID=MMETSP1042-20121227/5476_1 /TAXON_ID=464988 /ORGANISM="Hemiselmis andersenii, Strain CCMP1180" /LENGTH=236 /DNA_ID=CAMNT_0009546907 /DNA_START=337 /DNA_END=1043 /DNA_ORIENTATION=-